MRKNALRKPVGFGLGFVAQMARINRRKPRQGKAD